MAGMNLKVTLTSKKSSLIAAIQNIPSECQQDINVAVPRE